MSKTRTRSAGGRKGGAVSDRDCLPVADHLTERGRLVPLHLDDPRVPRASWDRPMLQPYWTGCLVFGSALRLHPTQRPTTKLRRTVEAICTHQHRSIESAKRCGERAQRRWAVTGARPRTPLASDPASGLGEAWLHTLPPEPLRHGCLARSRAQEPPLAVPVCDARTEVRGVRRADRPHRAGDAARLPRLGSDGDDLLGLRPEQLPGGMMSNA